MVVSIFALLDYFKGRVSLYWILKYDVAHVSSSQLHSGDNPRQQCLSLRISNCDGYFEGVKHRVASYISLGVFEHKTGLL